MRGFTFFINLFDWSESFDTFGVLPIGHFSWFEGFYDSKGKLTDLRLTDLRLTDVRLS